MGLHYLRRWSLGNAQSSRFYSWLVLQLALPRTLGRLPTRKPPEFPEVFFFNNLVVHIIASSGFELSLVLTVNNKNCVIM
jgi:hypothetical protein